MTESNNRGADHSALCTLRRATAIDCWRKVLEIEQPIVTLKPTQGKLRRIAACIKACVQNRLIEDDGVRLHPLTVHQRNVTLATDVIRHQYNPDAIALLEINRLYFQQQPTVKTVLLSDSIFDSVALVGQTDQPEAEPSVALLIRKETDAVYLSYFCPSQNRLAEDDPVSALYKSIEDLAKLANNLRPNK